jgi:WD40 repeat protein/serine/threonine protein kinase
MAEGYACDEDLLRGLPLPVAQLCRRAHNAKAPPERHLTALYLWEASLKLLASVAVVTYADRPEHDPQLAERLQALARPSVGHWWEFVRLLVPALADAGDTGFAAVRELLLGRTRDGLPRCAGLDALLREELEGKPGARATVRLTELFERLVTYRNKGVAHAAPGQRPGAFHERMASTLLAALGELLGRLDVLAGRRLLYVAEVRQVGSVWLVQRFELHGEAARRIASLELPWEQATQLPRGELVCLEGPGDTDLRPLHPLVLYDAESEKALYLNARRGKRRTEYLCYTTGQVQDRPDLGGEQRALLARVLGMGVAEEQAEQWAARAGEAESAGEPELPAGSRRLLGEFELLSELGRGGMGVVYRAWQPSLGRQVTLKCLFQTGDPKAEARFRREIRALGKVEHPGVVKVFTSGSEGEQWFYAMELVEGATLAAVCDRLQTRMASVTEVDLPAWHETLEAARAAARQAEKPLGDSPASQHCERPEDPPVAHAPDSRVKTAGRGYVRHVVELVRQVALAGHALHEAGVVHRDIKPGNIMLSADGSAAFLMDLGLAQLADDVEGRVTRTRQFVGTLRYASPEQVLAVGGLDRRSDVYGLGATLWELLALRPLYGATDETPDAELMRRIQLEEPERLRQRYPGLARDLEAVVHKCLEKDPARRYPTAAEVAEELQGLLDGKPVRARRVGRVERGWKWVRRHPWQAGLASTGAVLVLLLIVGGVALPFLVRMGALNRELHQANERLQETNTNLDAALGEAQHERGVAEANAKEAALERARADGLLYFMRIGQAQIAWRKNDIGRADQILEACKPEERKNWEWRYLYRLCHADLLTLQGHTDSVEAVSWSPDGTRLASTSKDWTVKVWDTNSGQQTLTLAGPASGGGSGSCVAWSPDGTRLASGGMNGVTIWDASTGKEALTRGKGDVNGVAWSPDGSRLGCAYRDGTVSVWDAKTGQEALTFKGHTLPVYAVAWSPDGTRLASASDFEVKIWDANNGQERLTIKEAATRVAFSPDGRRVAGPDIHRALNVWDAETGQLVLTVQGDTHWVRSVAFSPDGSRLAGADANYGKPGDVKVWNARTGKTAIAIQGHRGEVLGVCWSPDGSRLASASYDKTVKVWDAKTPQEALTLERRTGSGNSVHGVAFSPDGNRLASAEAELNKPGEVKVWDAQTGKAALTLQGHKGDVRGVCWSPDGNRLASAGQGYDEQKKEFYGEVKVWEVKTGQPTLSLHGHTSGVYGVAWSPDGTRLASACNDWTVRVWDAQTGQQILSFHSPYGEFLGVAWSPDGSRLAGADPQDTVKVWDANTGQERLTLKGHTQPVNGVAWSPDATRLASASWDGTVMVWDARTGERTLILQGHTSEVRGVAWSPDGTRLASASADQTVRIWVATTGQEALVLEGHTNAVESVSWSPDSTRLASASADGTVKLWPSRPLALPGGGAPSFPKSAQP